MAPLQIILLLLIVRLPRSLEEAGAAQAAYWGPLVHIPPAYVVASFILSHVLLVAFVFLRTRSALKVLDHPNASSVAVAARTDSLFQYARWATMALTAIHLYVFGMAGMTAAFLASTRHLGSVPLMAETFYLTPPLLAWIGIWWAAYQVEAANRERSLAYRMAVGLPAHTMPTLLQYLLMHIRHNFYILLPIALATGIEDISTRLDKYIPNAKGFGIFAALLSLILLMPWFITRAWNTVPLEGPLRNRLDAMAKQYGLKFRNILLWKTHNAITNAAILGYLPFSRYFLMTDALLETLTDQQIEAVFAHEVGHGVHRHIWWYFGGMIAVFMLATGITDVTVFYLPASLKAMLGGHVTIELVLAMILFMLFIALGFPFISHRFEHQADWFASRHMAKHQAAHPQSLAIPAAAMVIAKQDALPAILPSDAVSLDQYLTGNYPHAPQPGVPTADPPVAEPAPLKPTEIFISALDTIADLAHRSRNKKGWMHPSIADRIALLRRLANDPLMQKSFDRRMLRARLYIVAAFVAALAFNTYASIKIPDEPPATTQAVHHPHSSG
jgi:Zn-dependent protease with chaperone function